MIKIGPHLSIAKGYAHAAETASQIGASTFQFFTRNPRGGKAKALDQADLDALQRHLDVYNFAPLLAHAPYTMNLCAAKPSTAAFAEEMFRDDLTRLEKIPCQRYNFHPGSHTGQGVDVAIDKIVKVINRHNRGQWSTKLLLETMSGKGTEVGRSFQEIKQIIDGLDYTENIGVCLDTCHIFAAGYDIVNARDQVLKEFDDIIGLDRLQAIHFNDSKHGLASNKDRHEEIGKGQIGMSALMAFVMDERIKHLPIFLETPLEAAGHAKEIARIKTYISQEG